MRRLLFAVRPYRPSSRRCVVLAACGVLSVLLAASCMLNTEGDGATNGRDDAGGAAGQAEGGTAGQPLGGQGGQGGDAGQATGGAGTGGTVDDGGSDDAGDGSTVGSEFATCLYRSTIAISSQARPVPQYYTVEVTFDHATLVDNQKSRASGDDIRVGRFDGMTWSQRDRVLDSHKEGNDWNKSNTTIHFSIPEEIAPTNSSSTYYLFYGCNPSPAADPSAVYLFWDDFESSLGKWEIHDTPPGYWKTDNTQAHSGSNSLVAGGVWDQHYRLEARDVGAADVDFEAYWRLSYMYGVDISQTVRSQRGGGESDYEVNLVADTWYLAEVIDKQYTSLDRVSLVPKLNEWFPVSIRIQSTEATAYQSGSQLFPSADAGAGAVNVGTGLQMGSVGFRVFEMYEGQHWWIDDVRVRVHVDPPPKVHLGEEQAAPFIR